MVEERLVEDEVAAPASAILEDLEARFVRVDGEDKVAIGTAEDDMVGGDEVEGADAADDLQDTKVGVAGDGDDAADAELEVESAWRDAIEL